MLDNIVTDGMRVAQEVRKRMDEAQKELDKGASTRGTEDDDEEDGEDHPGDLLDVAEADAGAHGTGDSGKKSGEARPQEKSLLDKEIVAEPSKSNSSAASVKSTDTGVEKSTMFER